MSFTNNFLSSIANIDEFSHDVTAAISLFQNNETAAMFVYLDNPVGIELFSYVTLSFVPLN